MVSRINCSTTRVATLCVAALAAALAAPTAHPADLYLPSGSYTANDNTQKDNTIRIGMDSNGKTITPNTTGSTTSVSGGSFASIDGTTSVFNFTGGIFTKGIMLRNLAEANFIGMGLSFAYMDYGNTNPYNTYADSFKVTGIIGGVPNTSYNLYLANAAGSGGTGDDSQRQFGFVPPVSVPEAGSLVLILPALGVLGAVVVARRRAA